MELSLMWLGAIGLALGIRRFTSRVRRHADLGSMSQHWLAKYRVDGR